MNNFIHNEISNESLEIINHEIMHNLTELSQEDLHLNSDSHKYLVSNFGSMITHDSIDMLDVYHIHCMNLAHTTLVCQILIILRSDA